MGKYHKERKRWRGELLLYTRSIDDKEKSKRWEGTTRADVLPACLPAYGERERESHMFCVMSRSRQQQQQCFHQRRRKMRWRRDEAAAVHKRIWWAEQKEDEEKKGRRRRRRKTQGWTFILKNSQHTRLFSISPQKIARKRLLCRLFSWFFWKPNLYSHLIFLLVCLTVCVRALLSLLPCWKPCINLILYVSYMSL